MAARQRSTNELVRAFHDEFAALPSRKDEKDPIPAIGHMADSQAALELRRRGASALPAILHFVAHELDDVCGPNPNVPAAFICLMSQIGADLGIPPPYGPEVPFERMHLHKWVYTCVFGWKNPLIWIKAVRGFLRRDERNLAPSGV